MTLPEYTIGAAAVAAVTAVMDLRWVRTRVLADRRMPIVAALVLFFMILSNGWLTARPVVVYDNRYRLLPRLGSIPLEDFLFGFAVVIQALMWWEWAKRRGSRSRATAAPPPASASRSPRPGR